MFPKSVCSDTQLPALSSPYGLLSRSGLSGSFSLFCLFSLSGLSGLSGLFRLFRPFGLFGLFSLPPLGAADHFVVKN